MHCVTCGRPSRFNRAVQHSERGLVGTLCEDCERRRFAGTLAERTRRDARRCLLCRRPVVVALPEHRLVVDGRDDLEFGGYFLTDETPFLCEDDAPAGVNARPGTHLSDHPPVLVEE